MGTTMTTIIGLAAFAVCAWIVTKSRYGLALLIMLIVGLALTLTML